MRGLMGSWERVMIPSEVYEMMNAERSSSSAKLPAHSAETSEADVLPGPL